MPAVEESSMSSDAPVGTAMAAAEAATLVIDRSLPAKFRVRSQPEGMARLAAAGEVIAAPKTTVRELELVQPVTALLKADQVDAVAVLAEAGDVATRLEPAKSPMVKHAATSPARTLLQHPLAVMAGGPPSFLDCSVLEPRRKQARSPHNE